MLKIATWNINSVRLRIDLVKNILKNQDIDILCLQETKVVDDLFPIKDLEKIGYKHSYFSGEKSYNGVAIISKKPLSGITTHNFINEQKRHISAILPDGTELHNFYIPAGGDEPDPKINPKFKHKLDFCDEMARFFKKERSKFDKIIIVGDFNIAPLEHDVWSHKQLLKIVSHTPVEIEKMKNLKKTLEWIDTSREFVSIDKKLYSWWSYRNRDWRKSNRGRRLDHIWITSPLKKHLKDAYILTDERDRKKPSDHVPVIMEIDI